MLIFKWFSIIVIGIDFLADFIVKIKRNNKVSEYLGSTIGLGLRAYITYILITVWQV